eukprot:scaffold145754_cov68-Attheya_sp.AAC.1
MYTMDLARRKASNRAHSIIEAAKAHKWSRAHRIWKDISTSAHAIESIAELRAMKFSSSQNVLHFLCSRSPPADLVLNLIEACPDLVAESDVHGQYPLHIAVRTGASQYVVETLVDQCIDGVISPDATGRTPLMTACLLARTTEFCTCPLVAETPLYQQIVRILFVAAPEIINHKDRNGMTAVDYLIDARIMPDMVQNLRRASLNEQNRRLSVDLALGSKSEA